MPKTQILGALRTASGLLNLYTNFYPDWTKNDWVMSQKPYAHNIWKYTINLVDLWGAGYFTAPRPLEKSMPSTWRSQGGGGGIVPQLGVEILGKVCLWDLKNNIFCGEKFFIPIMLKTSKNSNCQFSEC